MSAQVQPALERFVPLSPRRIPEIVCLEQKIYPFPWTAGNFEDALRSGYSAWMLVSEGDAIIAYAVAMLAVDEAHLLNQSPPTLSQPQADCTDNLASTDYVSQFPVCASISIAAAPPVALPTETSP